MSDRVVRRRNYKINRIPRDELTADMVRERLDYDPHSGVFHWKVSPANNIPAGSVAGSLGRAGYIGIRLLHSYYPAHRLAWLHVYGSMPKILDHIDRNKTNNSISNLRVATASQNQANRSYRGYYYSTKDRRFTSSIWTNGKRVWLGFFDSAGAARAAYISAHLELHGQYSAFARLDAGGESQ